MEGRHSTRWFGSTNVGARSELKNYWAEIGLLVERGDGMIARAYTSPSRNRSLVKEAEIQQCKSMLNK